MKNLLTALATAAALIQPALAITEAGYARDFQALILPFYEAVGVAGEFLGEKGVTIRYRKFEVAGEKGAIVFAPGRGESYLTYPELEYDLVQAGYSIYVLDHRSQGFSGRITPDSQVVTVESYDYYVADLAKFVDTVVNAVPHARRYLLTNSMGGAIGALYLDRHPGVFDRAVMSVPMFEINTGKFPEPIALETAKLEVLLGHGDRFASLGGERPYDFGQSTDCALAGDGRQARRCEIEELVRQRPESASGGSSYRWVVQSLEALRAIRGQGLAERLTLPLMIFQAGHDAIVRPGGQDAFCAAAPHCVKLTFPHATHEILTESDEIRAPAMRAITEFLESR